MEKVDVPAQPGRLINAIASIGYDPEVALADLLDNSIDARSENVCVHILEDLHDIEGESDSVGGFIISDDGCGMDRENLINAFSLGSNRTYPKGSLGKFGIGLKSAGLSLGDKITLVSKTAGCDQVLCAILSCSEVEDTGEYNILLGEAQDSELEVWKKYSVDDSESGTVLFISELVESQPAFANFVKYLQRYFSNIYHMLLEEKSISISVNGKVLDPIDPLFFKEASENGSLTVPSDWDGRSPKTLLAHQTLALGDNAVCEIAATHLVHPPTFEIIGESRESAREKYQIESEPYTAKPRHGFFIYRNKRIIVMAERFHGLISRQTQAWAFRGRLMFDEKADSVLALDVKKRHVRLPKAARNKLKTLISNYQTKSIDAWKAAGKRYSEWKKDTKDDIANKSIASTPVADLSYSPGTTLTSEEQIQTRKELQQKLSKMTEEAIQDKSISIEDLCKRAEEKNAIVFVEGLKANSMWLPYAATELGRAETLVNKMHSWVSEAASQSEEDPKIALIVYQLFAILARAELEMRSTTWQDVSSTAMDKVFERFRRKASAIGEDLAETLSIELKSIENGNLPEE
ncbi:ATP-binding protein [Sedimenticola hydrogenitrophicus]|uniref:ATP-binding protein n=1 Tax=Sedimenticola hydrogenitrophicus TaxID=2967975 RepID=UPI0021A87A9C|nr:ATP-binding protein [Sedimenticola hydrogenitrophicus]